MERAPLAAALLPAAALWPLDATWRRSMTTGRPPWMGRPPLPGLCPARCLQGGRRQCIARSTVGWATTLERWRGRQGAHVRVRDLSSTHAHSTCASSPRTSRALLGNRPAPSPQPEMPMVTTRTCGELRILSQTAERFQPRFQDARSGQLSKIESSYRD